MKKVHCSETIAACDLKLIDLMKIFEYLRSRLFLDLDTMTFIDRYRLTSLFSETIDPFLTKF